MSTVLIQYQAGNLRSVGFALDRLGVNYIISSDPEVIHAADRVIFPGVGNAGFAMKQLQMNGLHTLLPTLTQPVLGICLGMQLLCALSDEGPTTCLGIFPDPVLQFPASIGKVPHMGWNRIDQLEGPLFKGIEAGDFVYFVHSYFVPNSSYTAAQSEYGGMRFSAAIQRDNIFGVQFHPERSGDTGMQVLRNFIEI